MTWVLSLLQIGPGDQPRVGGKCFALAKMARGSTGETDQVPGGVAVPETVCISAQAYRDYVAATGLRERIMLELGRKDFGDMRWEELWDASLRIRNMFLRTPIPGDLATTLAGALEARFGGEAVVVRSSAPGEDSDTVSFAGLHDSFVNVTGIERILEHVRLVWASLWSDAALLYRRDLGLDLASSTMAVVVQELVKGDRSGVVFSRSPNDDSQAVIESVYGLNQGLVDGTVEPDRWIVDRATGQVVSHVSPSRDQMLVTGLQSVHLESLPEELSSLPPLTAEEVTEVFDCSRRLEALFGGPQDVEWTWGDEGLVVLQSRPITTLAGGGPDDERRWYLSLRRSFENLQSLRDKIEGELIPGMIEEANALAEQPVNHLSDEDLAAEIDRRQAIYDGWVDVYWDKFIPFAHGIRLFGQVYNDALHPDDPYAFMDLLGGTEMASVARNHALEQMAAIIRDDAQLADALRERLAHRENVEIDKAFQRRVNDFVSRFGDLSCAMTGGARCAGGSDALTRILLEMAGHPRALDQRSPRHVEGQSRWPRAVMRDEFLDQFEGEEREQAAELLDLARTSYQLRDDDNIYLGRIEAEVLVAVEEGRRRLESRGGPGAGWEDVEVFRGADVARALRNPDFVPEASLEEETEDDFVIRARQLIGQPAGPGVAQGAARVVVSQGDLTAFEHGEILVCDAVDPNMTFVVPLAAAVVERRGGMLIHGAIIAREYGLPCVTGIPEATSSIRTGDAITVDGHLGIVTIGRRRGDPADDG
jgi:pyruvate,water dikinase